MLILKVDHQGGLLETRFLVTSGMYLLEMARTLLLNKFQMMSINSSHNKVSQCISFNSLFIVV